jgi:RNA polymerase sigma factor (sigma-70 family)
MSSIAEMRDEKLALLFRQTQDTRYYTALCERHTDRLTGLLRSNYIRMPELDIPLLISQTFEAFYTFLLSDAPLKHVVCWLSETAKNRAKAAVRWNERQKRGGTDIKKLQLFTNGTIMVEHDQLEPVEQLIQAEQFQMLHAAVASLPEHEQSIVRCKMEGLTDEETSEVLGIPKGTVKSAFHRARATLRNRLEEKICVG